MIYHHFRRIQGQGLWDQALATIRSKLRVEMGLHPRGHIAIVDSQSVRIGKTKSERGFDGGKKVYGRKRHFLVDSQGLLVDVKVTAANVHDRHPGLSLVYKTKCAGVNLIKELHADRAYQGLKVPRGTRLVIGKNPNSKEFSPIKHRWKIERTFAWAGDYRRLARDYEGSFETSEAMIKASFTFAMCKRLTSLREA